MTSTSHRPSHPALREDARRGTSAALVVQHLLTSQRDELLMQLLFDRVGGPLGTRFDLCRGAIGDIVLIDRGRAQNLAPQMLNAFKEGRPAVLLDVSGLSAAQAPLLRLQALDQQQDLLRQLSAILRVRRALTDEAAAPGGFDSRFDSRIDPEPVADNLLQRGQRLVLARARAGSADPSRPPLLAGYGPGRNLRLDFATGIVCIDPDADRLLRQGQTLPHPRPGDPPGPLHHTRALDTILWNLGVAGASLPLLDAPADWWHAALARLGRKPIAQLTQHPCYRALERELAHGPATPSALRRCVHCSVLEVRAFVQAMLLLGLAAWQSH